MKYIIADAVLREELKMTILACSRFIVTTRRLRRPVLEVLAGADAEAS